MAGLLGLTAALGGNAYADTITGTSGDDVIHGTSRADVIRALDGDDCVALEAALSDIAAAGERNGKTIAKEEGQTP